MDAPCTAVEAVARGQMILKARTGQYGLGSGDYHPPPYTPPLVNGDVPWTPSPDPKHPGPASDCAGFAICFCWKTKRHRPGFNRGCPDWMLDVEDDINCNSLIGDGLNKRELCTVLDTAAFPPKPGDLITYPTIMLKGPDGKYVCGEDGKPLKWIGHVGLIEEVPADYKPGEGWHRLTILQCHGPDGFTPGVVRSDGSIWDHHDHTWQNQRHRTVIVRMHERK